MPAHHSFRINQSGSLAIMMAIAALALIAIAGIAIDYARTIKQRTAAQVALDSATFMSAIAYDGSYNTGQAAKQGKKAFAANYTGDRPGTLDFDFRSQSIVSTYRSSTTTVMASLLGIDDLAWTVTSEVNYTPPNAIEIALAIDVSSSMRTGGHMGTLTSALHAFAREIFTIKTKEETVVSFVPFANAVSFPPEFESWLSPTDGYSRSDVFVGCFYREPKDSQASLSTAMVGSYIATEDRVINPNRPVSRQVPFCPRPDTQISLFQTSRNELDDRINSMQSYHGTNTGAAMSWAWRALSPNWRATFNKSAVYPRDYSSRNKKMILLFSDGKPNVFPWVKDKSSTKETQTATGIAELRSVCDAIRAEGNIDVNVVGYGVNDNSELRAELGYCVSGHGRYYPADRAKLAEVLKEIANTYTRFALKR